MEDRRTPGRWRESPSAHIRIAFHSTSPLKSGFSATRRRRTHSIQHPCRMNLTVRLIVLGLGAFAAGDAQTAEPKSPAPKTELQWRDPVPESDKLVSALRTDLASSWTTLIIALRYDCSCTGTYHLGFQLTRTDQSTTVAPWGETLRKERTGPSRPITQPELDRLLAEAISFYHSATLSVTPAEKAGPSPTNADEDAAWLKRYLAAGGPRFSGDSYGMEIRVLAPGVRKTHSNEWSRMPGTFSPWIKTFGILPQP